MSQNKTFVRSTSSSAPEFTKKLQNVICQSGQPVDLECCVRGYPAPGISWEVAGEPVSTTRCIRMEREGEKCKLSIKACTINEAQSYTCMAVNKLGKAVTTATVKIEGSSDESVKSPNTNRMAVWPPRPPTKKIPISARPNITRQIHGETISSLSKKFSTPPASKSVSPGQQGSVSTRNKPPSFVMPPHGKAAEEGESVRLTCSVTGEPDPSVTWERSGEDINSGGRHSMSRNDRLHYLEIRNAQIDDSGSYTVVVENVVGKISAGMYLDIRAKRTISPRLSLQTEEKSTNSTKKASSKLKSQSPPRSIEPLEELTTDDQIQEEKITDNTNSYKMVNGNRSRAQSDITTYSSRTSISPDKILPRGINQRSSNLALIVQSLEDNKNSDERINRQKTYSASLSPVKRSNTLKDKISRFTVKENLIDVKVNEKTPDSTVDAKESKTEERNTNVEKLKSPSQYKVNANSINQLYRSSESILLNSTQNDVVTSVEETNALPDKISKYSDRDKVNSKPAKHVAANSETVKDETCISTKRSSNSFKHNQMNGSSLKDKISKYSEIEKPSVNIKEQDKTNGVKIKTKEAFKIKKSSLEDDSVNDELSSIKPKNEQLPKEKSSGDEKLSVATSYSSHNDQPATPSIKTNNVKSDKKDNLSDVKRILEDGNVNIRRGSLDKTETSTCPQILIALVDTTADDGKQCTLSCKFTSQSEISVKWSKNGIAFSEHQDSQVEFDGKTAKLIIKEVYPEDEGKYSCLATNGAGKVETSCILKVNVPEHEPMGIPPSFIRKLQDISEDDGGTVTFSVQVAGTMPIEIIWVHNANEIPDSSEFRYVSSPDGCTFSMVIGEVFPEDAGLYSCEAYNKFGDAEVSCRLTVKEILNENIGVTNNSHHSTRRQSQNISKDEEEKISHIISKVNWSDKTSKSIDEGDSEHLSNNISSIPEILITEVPKRSSATSRITAAQVLKGPQSIAILRGETITLKTHFIGSPPPSITWIKGGNILVDNERVSIENQEGLTVLTIRCAASDDSGKYVVSVENASGSDCLFASVSVEGVPDPPGERPLVSDVNSHSAVLCWRGSPFDGGSVITGYIVEKCSLPEMRWLQVSRASHTTCINIRNLLADRRYVFRVRAENCHGMSDPSPESDPIFTVDHDDADSAIMDSKIVEVGIGHLLNERYDLQDMIGKGRFGIVYRCIEKRTGQTKAAKIIRCIKSKDRAKVKEEIEIMNRLRHPKLLQLQDAFESSKEMTLVMEFVSGGELFERIIADDFVLLERDCILFVKQICEAVKYMHDCNVIHLDLKPENILCETKTSHQIKIIDFGLAKLYDPSESIRVLFGTPEFVAPEVIGYEPVGPFSDMWSIGVICYVLLTGLSPFMGENDPETFTNITRAEYDFDDDAFDAISEDAKDFISQLFIKRPEKRITAAVALKHTWLAKEQNRMSSVQLSTDKLKRFIIRRKWQKTGNAIRALGRMVNLSGVLTTRTPLVCQTSLTDSDYASNSPYSSLSSGQDSVSPVLPKLDEDVGGSEESGMGDTDSVDSAQ